MPLLESILPATKPPRIAFSPNFFIMVTFILQKNNCYSLHIVLLVVSCGKFNGFLSLFEYDTPLTSIIWDMYIQFGR